MKTSRLSLNQFGLALTAVALALPDNGAGENSPIPFSQIGAKATAEYQGDALRVTHTAKGARLRCAFQKLEGRATAEGLWLESTGSDSTGKLRLVATAVGREQISASLDFHGPPLT